MNKHENSKGTLATPHNTALHASGVLAFFFKQPDARAHIREIARRTGLHPNTVLRDVTLLEKEGLLCVTRTRAVVEAQANRDDHLFLALKRLDNLKRVLLSGIVPFLDDAFGTPQAIILYGSYSRGEDNDASDIDIAVITTRDNVPAMDVYERSLGRPLHILTIDPKKAHKNLLVNLANGIVLKGYLAL